MIIISPYNKKIKTEENKKRINYENRETIKFPNEEKMMMLAVSVSKIITHWGQKNY